MERKLPFSFPDLFLGGLRDVVGVRFSKSFNDNNDELLFEVTRSLTDMNVKPSDQGCLAKERYHL